MRISSSFRVRAALVGVLAALLAAAGLTLTTRVRAQEPKTTVKTVGLRISAAAYKGEINLRPWFSTGTALALQVTHPKGGLIAMDKEQCKLELLTDDKGTDLIGKREAWTSVFGLKPKFSKDKKVALFELEGKHRPAAGAAHVRAKGTLVFKAAFGVTRAKQAGVALKKGTKIDKAGKIPWTIKRLGTWGKRARVVLTTNVDDTSVARLRFFGADGKEIGSKEFSSSRFIVPGVRADARRTYLLDEKVESATVVVEYWKTIETIKVPFDFKVTLGL